MALINLDPIFTLFETAKSAGLKYPKIRLRTGDRIAVVLTQAGPKSRYEGTISVTTGEPFGTPGSWHGRINLDGTTTVTRPSVLALLQDLAMNPAEIAAHYGRVSGNCCFCGRDLSTSKAGSSEVGYGPICADKYGLTWKPNGDQAEIQFDSWGSNVPNDIDPDHIHGTGYTDGYDSPF